LAKIATYKIKSGKMDGDEWANFAQTVSSAEQMPVYIYPHATLTTDELRADLKRLKVKYGVRAFVLDYIHLMTDEIRVQREDERSAYLSQRIQAITKDLDLIGITVDSVTKEGMGNNGHEPNLKLMRGSGQMLHDADNIFYMIPSPAFPEFRDLYLLKGRELTASGKAKITLRKNPDYPLFENAVTVKMEKV
jgi:replicative DNA helicase